MADSSPSKGNLTQAARTVLTYHDAGAQASPQSYTHAQAVGAVAVWADLLGLTNDPDKAIGIARTHVAAVDSGLEPELVTE